MKIRVQYKNPTGQHKTNLVGEEKLIITTPEILNWKEINRMFNLVLVQQKLKPTYQDGMASAGVPLVGRRLRGHVEVGKA